jgi:hypothetical protein
MSTSISSTVFIDGGTANEAQVHVVREAPGSDYVSIWLGEKVTIQTFDLSAEQVAATLETLARKVRAAARLTQARPETSPSRLTVVPDRGGAA